MPVITLTSDIGQEDFIIGAVKGQILSTIPTATIADITHYLSSKNYQQGAYIFNNAAKHFPKGTVHIDGEFFSISSGACIVCALQWTFFCNARQWFFNNDVRRKTFGNR
jgi:hypothetical protein